MLTSFEPVVGKDPVILVLGSMPGVRSLEEQQYYAHPRNAFWPIMGELFGATPGHDYQDRLDILTGRGIVLWDVLRHCNREGSLDSDIDINSEVPNAIPELIEKHRGIRRILLNGGKAATAFKRHVVPMIDAELLPEVMQMPSTSPANARMSADEKLAIWRQALSIIL